MAFGGCGCENSVSTILSPNATQLEVKESPPSPTLLMYMLRSFSVSPGENTHKKADFT